MLSVLAHHTFNVHLWQTLSTENTNSFIKLLNENKTDYFASLGIYISGEEIITELRINIFIYLIYFLVYILSIYI